MTTICYKNLKGLLASQRGMVESVSKCVWGVFSDTGVLGMNSFPKTITVIIFDL